jgi:hypothetical protein
MPEIPEKFYKVHNRAIVEAMDNYVQSQGLGVRGYAILPLDPFYGVSEGRSGEETYELVYIEVCNERGVLRAWVSPNNLAAIERWLEKFKRYEIEDFKWPDIFPSSRD